MVDKYSWLTIRYELDKESGRFLVSFYPIEEIEKNDKFNIEVMEYEDSLYAKYGDYAPLFCDNENLFELSGNAITIHPNVHSNSYRGHREVNSVLTTTDTTFSDKDTFTEKSPLNNNNSAHQVADEYSQMFALAA